jgi:hypothetical protein
MSWDQTLDLYFNVDARSGNSLLLIEGTSVRESYVPLFVQGDNVLLRLYPRRKLSTGSAEAVELAADAALAFAGKLKASLGTGAVLFSCESFALVGTGDDANWQGALSFNTEELAAAFAGETAELSVRCDIEIQNADNSRRITLQADATVRRQVYDGATAATPLLNRWQEYLNGNGAKCLRLLNSDGETLAAFAPAGETP